MAARVGRRLDSIIVTVVPDVRKAVRWNSPFYGIDGNGWFLRFHCFSKYIKVAFPTGESLSPPPPVNSKPPAVRYLHIYQSDGLDEARLADWASQACRVPGEPLV